MQPAHKILDKAAGIWPSAPQGVRRDLRVVPKPAHHVRFQLWRDIIAGVGHDFVKRNIYGTDRARVFERGA